MGSRPSTSISPGEARGSRSRTAHPNEGDQTSNEVAGPEEITLGYEDYQKRREWPGYNPRLPCRYDPFSYPSISTNMREVDDDAGGELSGAMNASHRDDHWASSAVHDYVFDDEDPARLGDEAAYCRAAADSRHLAS